MNILITGGCGFIGSNFLHHMVKKYSNCKFTVIDKISYCSSIKNLTEIIDKIHFYPIDLCNIKELESVFKIEKITHVVHFAAETHVDNSFRNRIEFVNNNISSTQNLMEMIMKYPVEKFIHVSTDEVYGTTNEKVNEKVYYNPSNPYAMSKVCCEYVVKNYLHLYKLPIIITRGNNVYGPRQYIEKLIPKFIIRSKLQMELPIHGDGSETRNYLYVQDAVEAFEIILFKGEIGIVYNIGNEIEYSNLEIAKKICDEFKLPYQKIIHVENRKINDKRYLIDSTSLHDLGWKPKINLEDGLKLTIEWYKNINEKDYWENFENAIKAFPKY